MPTNLSCDWSVLSLDSHWSEQVYSTGVQRLDYGINLQKDN